MKAYRYWLNKEHAMSVTDELLANNERYAEGFDKGELPLPPARGIAVVACMLCIIKSGDRTDLS
jgi:hypothetical protein